MSNVRSADDIPQVTDEGRRICGEAAVNPADLLIRNKDFFLKSAQCEEVAVIRFEHYKNKRNSKFHFLFTNFFL